MTISAEAVFHSFREAVTRFIRCASSNPDRARGAQIGTRCTVRLSIGTLATMKYRRYGKGEGEETALIERRHGLGGSVDVLHLGGVQLCMDFECI